MLPGPDVLIVDQAPPPGTLSDTGTGFIVGLADRGPAAGQLAATDAVTSLDDFVTKYGARQSYNATDYDSVESFFAEQGSRLFFSRKVGPAAAKATVNVPVAASKFRFDAKSPGAWGNNLTVTVASGVITIRENGVLVETSPVLADATAAQAWAAASSRYGDITQLATGALTDTAALAATGGADDRTNITDTQIQAALDRFGKELGPGQVLLPGDTRAQAHAMLATHARDRNRFAYGDLPDTPTVATLTGLAATVRALGRELARHIQLFDQWAVIDGTTPGTERVVPWSAIQAGLAARSDRDGNPNRAVAGPRGISQSARRLKYVHTAAERSTLADAGVTAVINGEGGIQAYDDVTTVDPTVDPEWLGAAGNRWVMGWVSEALSVAAAHMFAQNSGPADPGAFGGDLKARLAVWRSRGALFSLDGTPESAYRVETGATVNTAATRAQRKLVAATAFRLSPNNRQVTVQVTNVPLSQPTL